MTEPSDALPPLDPMDVETFAELLSRPSPEQQAALIGELGEPRYRRMRELALSRGTRRATDPAGNVVVLHGIMGGELSALDRGGARSRVWLRLQALLSGQTARLRLAGNGSDPYDPAYDVRASGILKRHYGELLLALAADWTVRAFWYDWRKDLSLAADQLSSQVREWFGDAPVHLVAHSMGGLVARTFVARQPEQWKAMRGRLVMLGTPNHGSFAIPQAITGLDPLVRKLALADLRRNREELLAILNSFPGTFQMLPSPLRRTDMQPLYDSATWGELRVAQAHLDMAREHHELLADAVDERMVYVAGAGVATFAGVDPHRPGDVDGYTATWNGDGRVPHALGLLDGVRTYYAETNHGGLTCHAGVLDCLGELLTTGETVRLATEPPQPRADDGRALAQLLDENDHDVANLAALVTTPTPGIRSRSPAPQRLGAAQEREVEDELVSNVLQGSRQGVADTARSNQRPRASIRIRLAAGAIEDIHEHAGLETIDVLATGHYADVFPQAAERALDIAISAALDDPQAGEAGDRVLRGFTRRGVIRGRLGEPFLLPDPRDPERLIAIAGMGEPGRFGVGELTVLARELCWALGRLRKRHLATVVIGAGNGNLPLHEAIGGWLRGIRLALTGEDAALETVTFVELDPRKVCRIHEALLALAPRADAGIDIDYELLEDLGEMREAARQHAMDEARRLWDEGDDTRNVEAAPTRITLSLDGDTYRFGAITGHAAIPERAITLDPALVLEANDELAAEGDRRLQSERGRFLGRLLLPQDFLPHLATPAPLVMLLDGTTAAVHWEMVGESAAEAAPDADDESFLESFLGTRRGLTRQLRTRFAPPPEPPPPPSRTLRVLVVADPAADARLPGAEEEGNAVAEAFERFNVTYPDATNSVSVRSLLGPRDATRTNVLRELSQRSYDVVHFAGHCVYDEQEPSRSGWVFSGGQRIATNELSRIDRVPRLVVSNACESGVMADDASAAHGELAPTFAGTFLARGVSELVCTAWPVNDAAALQFATVLYSHLLGLPLLHDEPAGGVPAAMHTAMCEARRAIAVTSRGAHSWGAYQHYGNPYFKLFERI